jgi:hypothetical protein
MSLQDLLPTNPLRYFWCWCSFDASNELVIDAWGPETGFFPKSAGDNEVFVKKPGFFGRKHVQTRKKRDRPQRQNPFNIRNIIPSRDRLFSRSL